MKTILSTLALTLVISPAFAGQGGFGVGGPDSYIWAETHTQPARIAGRRAVPRDAIAEGRVMEESKRLAAMDQSDGSRIPSGGRMNSDLVPASTFYGEFL